MEYGDAIRDNKIMLPQPRSRTNSGGSATNPYNVLVGRVDQLETRLTSLLELVTNLEKEREEREVSCIPWGGWHSLSWIWSDY
jgi:hypothetical protein